MGRKGTRGGSISPTGFSSTGENPSRSYTSAIARTGGSRSTTWQATSRRAFGPDFLNSPSGFVTFGEFMVVAELRARLVVIDLHDSFVCELGENGQVCEVDGWPNNKSGDEIVPTKLLEAGKFNSPHGMAIDSHDNLNIAEWLIGGRVTKLSRS